MAHARCEGCREEVSPDDPEVVKAVELVNVGGFGVASDEIEGETYLFHERCFPEGSPIWRRT